MDDIELAKTAGSPAFFAPEMCYTGFESELSPRSSRSPHDTPVQELPGITLRPPSVSSEFGEHTGGIYEGASMSPGGRTFPLVPTTSHDSGLSRRPFSERTRSSATVLRQQRHPITNAIDVWALGITLYCLLFGRPPFDAPNEYLLMQVIPIANYEVPTYVSADKWPTKNGSLEVQDCLDLLRRLLEKEPAKRITLEQAKVCEALYTVTNEQRHPFTLGGIEDPSAWLASTDPHAQTFVTVSSDEVAAVVIKSNSFRDRFRKGFRTISHKLQIFGNPRHRSRSIGDGDSGHTSGTSGQSSTATSQTNLVQHGKRGVSRDASPLTSPAMGGSISRRLSAFGHRPDIPSPRRASTQLASPPLDHAPEMSSRSVSSQSGNRGFVVHRQQTGSVPKPEAIVLLCESGKRPTPRTVASTGSIDMLRSSESSPADTLQRRRSSDIDSNASSGLGHKLINILTRSRSRPRANQSDRGESAARRSVDAKSSESIGSDLDSVSTDSHQMGQWGTRIMPPIRRSSILSEVHQDRETVTEMLEDEVDWVGGNEDSSDEDDYENHKQVPTPSLDPIPDMSPIVISTPSRHGSPKSIKPRSPGGASAPSWFQQGDRARSPLRAPDLDLESSSSEVSHDGGLSYVSKRSR